VYRSILLPLDGSALSERALSVAVTLGAHLGCDLHIVHVYRQRVVDELPVYGLTGDAARAAAEQYVLGAADRVRAADVNAGQRWRVDGTVLDGSPASAIVHHIPVAGADLVVMGSHGRTGASRFWLGSVADAVIRSATVPVLLVRQPPDVKAPGQGALFERVLVPLDGSALAETALPHAMNLAKLNAAHVHLLQVEERAEDRRTSVWGLAAHEPDDLPARLDRADKYLHSVVARYELQWPPATVSVEARGAHRVGEAITQVATERDADLIAMATHGRGASRLLLGSVADKVIRGTTCSILLCRSRE
jgi:nucleotide-binding universal stress UspA family protein